MVPPPDGPEEHVEIFDEHEECDGEGCVACDWTGEVCWRCKEAATACVCAEEGPPS